MSNYPRHADNMKPTQSMGRGKSEVKDMSEIWRESADLQNRVKNAI
jgi:hypothetical protein